MKYLTPQQQNKQDIYKAADLAVEWQTAWRAFQAQPSKELARSVISKGETLLSEQERLVTKFQRSEYIKYRVLVAEDYLSKAQAGRIEPRSEALNQSTATQKLQKFLDGL
jgi:hypothetical protein